MITNTNTAPTINSHTRFDRPRLAALRHASSSIMARYRNVNLVTKRSRAFFYLAIPFRDHSLPKAFRFTKTIASRRIRFSELENRCTGNRTRGFESHFSSSPPCQGVSLDARRTYFRYFEFEACQRCLQRMASPRAKPTRREQRSGPQEKLSFGSTIETEGIGTINLAPHLTTWRICCTISSLRFHGRIRI